MSQKAGAPKGSHNGRDGARWRQALRRALARKCGSVSEGLIRAAAKVADAAIDDGDLMAANHIADRFDGKATQRIEGRVTHEHSVDAGDESTYIERLQHALQKRTEPALRLPAPSVGRD